MLLFAVGLYLFFLKIVPTKQFESYNILQNRFYFTFFSQAPRERPPVPLSDNPPGPARVGRDRQRAKVDGGEEGRQREVRAGAPSHIQGEEGGAGKGNGIHGGHSGLSGKWTKSGIKKAKVANQQTKFVYGTILIFADFG